MEMGKAEVEVYFSFLASERQVSASTQNQTKAALLFLYREVLGQAFPWLDEVTSVRQAQKRLPAHRAGRRRLIG
ncbi:hypothetical protein C2I19_20105 [Chromobacterium alticapitis]|uniref:Integrase SAM-like N-terminal domain-containing protein n=2 Tax=Chromobacterium alticapitis TaxID=2073169 RepID=A0A2S5DB43_9NEIS|nr:hypothetical protein C2I19_20105 [Chromobacterium alticapitis]